MVIYACLNHSNFQLAEITFSDNCLSKILQLTRVDWGKPTTIVRPYDVKNIVVFCIFSESAFSDDRLTICCQMQEAALKTLRGEYGEG